MSPQVREIATVIGIYVAVLTVMAGLTVAVILGALGGPP